MRRRVELDWRLRDTGESQQFSAVSILYLGTRGIRAVKSRISLRLLFIAHAVLKVFASTVPGCVGYFASLDLPT